MLPVLRTERAERRVPCFRGPSPIYNIFRDTLGRESMIAR
jgi:hypothetical protein